MKRIFTFGLLAAAAFALTNCAQKESYAPVQEEVGEVVPFKVIANLPAETKTINDGMSTKWVNGDALTLSYTYEFAGNVYTNDFNVPFVTTGDGVFTANVGFPESIAALLKLSAVYPYTEEGDYVIPKYTVQKGYNSMKHLAGANCPLYGEITVNADYKELLKGNVTTPELKLNHTTSIVELNVKNGSEAPLVIDTVGFRVGQDVKGFTKVEGAEELAVGEIAKVYIVVEPFTVPAGDTEESQLVFWVNNTPVKIDVTENDVTFAAGKIKRVAYLYEGDRPERYIVAQSEVQLDAERVVPSVKTLIDCESVKQWAIALKDQENTMELLQEALLYLSVGELEVAYDLLGGIPGFELQAITLKAAGEHMTIVDYSVASLMEKIANDIKAVKSAKDLENVINTIEGYCLASGLADPMNEFQKTFADLGFNALEELKKIPGVSFVLKLFRIEAKLQSLFEKTIFDVIHDALTDETLTMILDNYVLSDQNNAIRNLIINYILDAVESFEDRFDAYQFDLLQLAIADAKANAYSDAVSNAEAALIAKNNEELAKLEKSIWGLFRCILELDTTKSVFEELQLVKVYDLFNQVLAEVEETVQYDKTDLNQTASTYKVVTASQLAE